MKYVTISSTDGTANTVKIIDEGGNEFLAASHVNIALRPNEPNRAEIGIELLNASIHAEVNVVVRDLNTGKFRPVAQIIFADNGEVMDFTHGETIGVTDRCR
ncbi:hypothetical protein QM467_04755 [Rhodoblastus sp. 17X3]|uniref:hypothetical protein n=1 Tax=Rhodoblastus sp. 17X3 TaxID=3047026 RepID=UPI0024B84814|nr:hypothetical protein [Rhodoblastus sp. 17X3]MDI9847370.1 hypothetical protein [Rhodoblastus sp. 17X3]